ncbi:MAG TPA: M48 family peptidase [Blastocatellia bacterium]|nr:M48 family peptidase [Blastocatellia bacterium]
MIEYEQLHLYSPVTSDETLQTVFEQALRGLVKKEPLPKVEARFYPYAGLSSTIRLRQGRVLARVSDILNGSPREVLFALACILVAKLYRLKASKTHERVYKQHTLDAPILNASQAVRRRRGYKMTSSSRGKVYDLADLFSELNTRYFGGAIARPMLSWSQKPTRRVLGHHDHIHQAIIISSTLDNASIPRFVVEYVLYHEMLHVKHPARIVSGRTVYHGRAFRDEERRYERFEEALKWLEKVAVSRAGQTRRRRRRACS